MNRVLCFFISRLVCIDMNFRFDLWIDFYRDTEYKLCYVCGSGTIPWIFQVRCLFFLLLRDNWLLNFGVWFLMVLMIQNVIIKFNNEKTKNKIISCIIRLFWAYSTSEVFATLNLRALFANSDVNLWRFYNFKIFIWERSFGNNRAFKKNFRSFLFGIKSTVKWAILSSNWKIIRAFNSCNFYKIISQTKASKNHN